MKIERRGIYFRKVCPLLILLFFLYAPVSTKATVGIKNGVNIKDGLMNADLASVPLKNILQDIKAANSIEYRGENDILNEKITISFDSLSVEKGLRRILNRFNYTITFYSDGMPASIYVYGKKGDNAGNARPVMAERPSQHIDNETEDIRNQISAVEEIEPRQFQTKRIDPNTLGKTIKIPAPDRSRSIDSERHRY